MKLRRTSPMAHLSTPTKFRGEKAALILYLYNLLFIINKFKSFYFINNYYN